MSASGWWLLPLGGFIVLTTVRLCLDPNGEISCSGTTVTDPELKPKPVFSQVRGEFVNEMD
jgi:hypothetical protein